MDSLDRQKLKSKTSLLLGVIPHPTLPPQGFPSGPVWKCPKLQGHLTEADLGPTGCSFPHHIVLALKE